VALTLTLGLADDDGLVAALVGAVPPLALEHAASSRAAPAAATEGAVRRSRVT
jgi:hypothetical protein